jgi:hypothetical protein
MLPFWSQTPLVYVSDLPNGKDIYCAVVLLMKRKLVVRIGGKVFLTTFSHGSVGFPLFLLPLPLPLPSGALGLRMVRL